MTRERNDSHSTEFGLWLRRQKGIDSSLGYVATNLDYIWSNYKNGRWMLIEEKRYNSLMRLSQEQMFKKLDVALSGVEGYKGFHLLKFENTGPEDGRMWLDGKLITIEQLLSFLQFKKEEL